MKLNIGTAGWSIPRALAADFPAEGSSLERYATRLKVTEINSSFHRPHRSSTWQRWHDSVPDAFRFSVKIPKTITHQNKLIDCAALLDDFLAQAHILGSKLAVLLVQLPPKLAFDERLATSFFAALAARTDVPVACEPRHPSWFTVAGEATLEQARIARVAADPAICENAGSPSGWRGLSYWRLHGSPVVYRSSYDDRIGELARALQAHGSCETWCIFDNTASSAGAGDALALMRAMQE